MKYSEDFDKFKNKKNPNIIFIINFLLNIFYYYFHLFNAATPFKNQNV